MLKVEYLEAMNFHGAFRGMRNPHESWDKSDSEWQNANFCDVEYVVGEDDLDLARRLYRSGSDERKFMRQIFICCDIIAPLYWWKEFDTYKIGTVTNSCSTMHSLHKRDLTADDFSNEHLFVEGDSEDYESNYALGWVIDKINYWRRVLIKNGTSLKENKPAWWQMIQLLPSSYNQRRTVTLNYEVAAVIILRRKNHKLDEWRTFVKELENLPYLKEIMS